MKHIDPYDLKKYEIRAYKDIQKWEKESYSGFHKKLQDSISAIIEYGVKKVGEEKFQSVENAIKVIVEKLLYASKFTVDSKRIIQKAHSHGMSINDISDLQHSYLKILDDCNQSDINFHIKSATLHGAVAGIGGELLATVDLTTLLIQDFNMIQNIAYCYAFDPDNLIEKQIILKIIEGGIGGTDIKFSVLNDIDLLKKEIKKQDTHQKMTLVTTKFLDRYVKSLAAAMIVRILSCSLPIISMAISAHSNHEIIKNSSEIGLMVYRKRFIERKREKERKQLENEYEL